GIQIDLCFLSHFHLPDVTLGNKPAQIELLQIHHGENRLTCSYHPAWLRRARQDRSCDRGGDGQITHVSLETLQQGLTRGKIRLSCSDLLQLRLRLLQRSLCRQHLFVSRIRSGTRYLQLGELLVRCLRSGGPSLHQGRITLGIDFSLLQFRLRSHVLCLACCKIGFCL